MEVYFQNFARPEKKIKTQNNFYHGLNYFLKIYFIQFYIN